MLGAKITQEKLVQRLLVGFAYGVARDTVRHDFNYATNIEIGPCSVGKSMVGEEIEP
jgi:hypothetical protein